MHKKSRSQEWLNWGIRVVMAKNYIDNLREEAMKGWAEKLAQGWLPAPPPPGYMTIPEHGKRIHVPDPLTSKLMLKAFKFYLKPGETLESTVRYMAKLGIVSRSGKPYAKSHLQKILMNPFYIGINHFDGKRLSRRSTNLYPKASIQACTRKTARRPTPKLPKAQPIPPRCHTLRRLRLNHNLATPKRELLRCLPPPYRSVQTREDAPR